MINLAKSNYQFRDVAYHHEQILLEDGEIRRYKTKANILNCKDVSKVRRYSQNDMISINAKSIKIMINSLEKIEVMDKIVFKNVDYYIDTIEEVKDSSYIGATSFILSLIR